MIGFFSSQQRPLYIEDMYRVLALPKDYVIQFRYKESDIEDELKRDVSKLINNEAIIFYTVEEPKDSTLEGPTSSIDDTKQELEVSVNQDTDKEKKPPKNIPIRKAKLIDVYLNDELGYINFYLELGDFVNCEVSDILNNPLQFPPKKYVSNLAIQHFRTEKWLNVIDRVKPYFEESLRFVYIKSIRNKRDLEIPYSYDSIQRRCLLNLNDEGEYILEVLTYDKTEGTLIIDIIKDDKLLDISGRIPAGNEVDTSILGLRTRSIDFKNQSSILSFSTVSGGKRTYTVDFSVTLLKRPIKSLFFGLMSALGSLGLLIGTYTIKDVISPWYSLLAVAFIGIGAGYLHWNFNKK